MKIFKCPNCKDITNKENNIIMVQCPCGYHMQEVDSKHNPIDTRNEAEKICDAHECKNCPIRGVKCFGWY